MNLLYELIDYFWRYIEYCIFDLKDIIVAKESLILNFSYITIDYFWCYFTHTEVHITPIEHISVKLVFDHELPMHTFWLYQVLDMPDISPYLTDWTYFWPNSIRSRNFYTYSLTPSDFISTIQKSILELITFFPVPRVLDHELYKDASHWRYFSHRVLYLWRNGHFSGKIALDHELSTYAHWLYLMLHQTYRSPYLAFWT